MAQNYHHNRRPDIVTSIARPRYEPPRREHHVLSIGADTRRLIVLGGERDRDRLIPAAPFEARDKNLRWPASRPPCEIGFLSIWGEGDAVFTKAGRDDVWGEHPGRPDSLLEPSRVRRSVAPLDEDDAKEHHRDQAEASQAEQGSNSLWPHGLSRRARLSLPALEFLDLRGLEQVVLVGHSSGCTVAAQLAVTHPERVSHVVFIAPPGPMAHYAVDAYKWLNLLLFTFPVGYKVGEQSKQVRGTCRNRL